MIQRGNEEKAYVNHVYKSSEEIDKFASTGNDGCADLFCFLFGEHALRQSHTKFAGIGLSPGRHLSGVQSRIMSFKFQRSFGPRDQDSIHRGFYHTQQQVSQRCSQGKEYTKGYSKACFGYFIMRVAIATDTRICFPWRHPCWMECSHPYPEGSRKAAQAEGQELQTPDN